MRLMALTLLALVSALNSVAWSANETPKRSAELQVLDRFVGTWDLAVTHKPKGGTATSDKTFEFRKWSEGGQFIHFHNPQRDKPEAEFHMLITYDAAKKSYTGVLMVGATRTFVDGSWDEATKTMRFHGAFPDNGGKFDFKNRFVDADRIEASGVFTDRNGEVFLERSDVQTRRKAEKQ